MYAHSLLIERKAFCLGHIHSSLVVSSITCSNKERSCVAIVSHASRSISQPVSVFMTRTSCAKLCAQKV